MSSSAPTSPWVVASSGVLASSPRTAGTTIAVLVLVVRICSATRGFFARNCLLAVRCVHPELRGCVQSSLRSSIASDEFAFLGGLAISRTEGLYFLGSARLSIWCFGSSSCPVGICGNSSLVKASLCFASGFFTRFSHGGRRPQLLIPANAKLPTLEARSLGPVLVANLGPASSGSVMRITLWLAGTLVLLGQAPPTTTLPSRGSPASLASNFANVHIAWINNKKNAKMTKYQN